MYRAFKFLKFSGNRLVLNSLSKNSILNFSKQITNISKFNFSEKFERVNTGNNNSLRGSGNLNVKEIFTGNENINQMIEFFENNFNQMNDNDYLDAIMIISYKLGSDSGELAARRFRTSRIYENLKTWIRNNIDKYLEYNTLNFLIIAYQSFKKNLMLIENTKKGDIVRHSLAMIERSISSGRVQINNLFINLITCYELSDDVTTKNSIIELMRSKFEEIKELNPLMLLRISLKINEMKPSLAKSLLVREFYKYVFENLENEKLTTKAKIFSVWSQISKEGQFNNFNLKLNKLLKEIRNNVEEYDRNVILSLLNGLQYLKDSSQTNETLEEIIDILLMTIDYRADNLKYEFVLKIIECLNNIDSEKVLNTEKITKIIEYLTRNVPIDRSNILLPLFKIMRKHKYNDVAQIEKLFNLIVDRSIIYKLPVNDNLESFKSVISNNLGESYLQVADKNMIEELNIRNDNATPRKIIENLIKSMFFGNDKSNETSDKFFQVLTDFIKNEKELSKLKYVICETADKMIYLKNYKENVTNLVFETVKSHLNQFENINLNLKIVIFINLMKYQTFNQNQSDMFRDIKNVVNKSQDFKNRILNVLLGELSDERSHINKSMYLKLVPYIKELVQSEGFLESNPKVLQNLILINYEYIDKSKLEDLDMDVFIRIADNLHEKNPNLKMMLNTAKVMRLVKFFDQKGIESKILNVELADGLRNNRINNIIDQTVALSKILKTNIEDKESLISSYINNDNIISKIDEINQISSKCRFYTLASQLNRRNLISDEKMLQLTNLLINKFVNEDENPNLIEIPVVISNVKIDLLRKLENKEYLNKVKNIIVSLNSIKRIIRTLKLIQSSNEISNSILMNATQVYIKEQNSDKNYLLELLDLFTKLKWRSTNFYNKIISDYEELFDKFNSNDHAQLINYFSRIHLKKDDVIKAAIKAINFKYLNEKKKSILFNDLVHLGFYDNEWKELILTKLYNDIDFKRPSPKNVELRTLYSLWILKDWPANNSEIVDIICQNLNRLNYKRFDLRRDDLLVISSLKFSSFYEKFDDEFKKNIDETFEKRIETLNKMNTFKVFIEALKLMNVNFEIANDLFNLYLPDEKIGIIFYNKSHVSLIDNKPMEIINLYERELSNRGITAVTVNLGQLIYESKTNEDLIKNIENLKIPNKNSGSLDFTSLEILRKFNNTE